MKADKILGKGVGLLEVVINRGEGLGRPCDAAGYQHYRYHGSIAVNGAEREAIRLSAKYEGILHRTGNSWINRYKSPGQAALAVPAPFAYSNEF